MQRTAIVALLLTVCPARLAFADGRFFSRAEVADEPGITAQRAVIAFRDGIETLIVQSDVDAQGSSLGWVFPIPAPPTSIEVCPPNTLTALSRLAGPRLLSDPYRFRPFEFNLVILVVVAFVCAACLRLLPAPCTPLRVLFVLLALAFLWSLMLPMYRSSAPSSGVEVLHAARAGIYDVSVIQGPTGDAVSHWLTSNGFACPPAAVAVIADYAANHWCFLTARVAPEAGGQARHHPLQVTFPAAQPVYPLRLTGVGGDPIQLDLYVIADWRASVPSLETWFSDTYFRRDGHRYFNFGPIEARPVYEGGATRSQIGLPAITALMWSDCVLTRLRGRLRSGDMAADLTLQWLPARKVQATVYARRDAIPLSAAPALLVCSVGLAIGTLVASRTTSPRRHLARRGLPIALALALVVGIRRYRTFEVVPLRPASQPAGLLPSAIRSHEASLQQLSEKPPSLPFPEAYRQMLKDCSWPAPPRETDSLDEPGDYHIDSDGDGWRLIVLDEYYIPVSIPISSQGTP